MKPFLFLWQSRLKMNETLTKEQSVSRGDFRYIYDNFIFEDTDYELVDSRPIVVFDPQAYGITPYECDHRNAKPFDFVCAYRIKQNALYLEGLGIKANNGHYPRIQGSSAINGRRAWRNKTNKYLGYPYSSPESQATREGGRFYRFTDFKLAYTGTIWLGRGIAQDYSRWNIRGMRDETAYETVKELTIDRGAITATYDRSQQIALVRARYEHIARLRSEILLTSEDRQTLGNLMYYPAWREVDAVALDSVLIAIERATYKPKHFVEVLTEHYAAATLHSNLLRLDDFAAKRVPRRLLDELDHLIRSGSPEKGTLAYFLKTLFASPAGRGVDESLRTEIDMVVEESKLPESTQRTIESMLEDISPELWRT